MKAFLHALTRIALLATLLMAHAHANAQTGAQRDETGLAPAVKPEDPKAAATTPIKEEPTVVPLQEPAALPTSLPTTIPTSGLISLGAGAPPAALLQPMRRTPNAVVDPEPIVVIGPPTP